MDVNFWFDNAPLFLKISVILGFMVIFGLIFILLYYLIKSIITFCVKSHNEKIDLITSCKANKVNLDEFYTNVNDALIRLSKYISDLKVRVADLESVVKKTRKSTKKK